MMPWVGIWYQSGVKMVIKDKILYHMKERNAYLGKIKTGVSKFVNCETSGF